MLAPIRRSLSERILESSRHCRVCIRHLHDQHPLRGPATAEAQVAEDYIPPLRPKSDSRSPQSSKGNFNGPPNRQVKGQPQRSPSTSKHPPMETKPPLANVVASLQRNRSKQQTVPEKLNMDQATGRSQQPTSGAATADPAAQLGFDERKVRATYPAPDGNVLPRRIEYLKKKGKTTVSHKVDYETDPLGYIEDGLKIRTKIEFAQLRAGGCRVRLTAAYHKQTLVAMGDGPTKVTILFTERY